MKNKPVDMANHVTAAMERLSDESLSPEQIAAEVQRSKAVTSLGMTYVAIGRLEIDAFEAAQNAGLTPTRVSNLIEHAPSPAALPAPPRRNGAH